MGKIYPDIEIQNKVRGEKSQIIIRFEAEEAPENGLISLDFGEQNLTCNLDKKDDFFLYENSVKYFILICENF